MVIPTHLYAMYLTSEGPALHYKRRELNVNDNHVPLWSYQPLTVQSCMDRSLQNTHSMNQPCIHSFTHSSIHSLAPWSHSPLTCSHVSSFKIVINYYRINDNYPSDHRIVIIVYLYLTAVLYGKNGQRLCVDRRDLKDPLTADRMLTRLSQLRWN
jgi:hypothetical protein